MKKTRENEHGAQLTRFAIGICSGIGISLVVSIGILGAAAMAISNGMLDGSDELRLAIAAGFAGAMAGALWAIRKCGARGLLVGLAVGAGAFLIFLTAGIALFGAGSIEQGNVGILCACLIGGAAAHILLNVGNQKRRKRRKNVK